MTGGRDGNRRQAENDGDPRVSLVYQPHLF